MFLVLTTLAFVNSQASAQMSMSARESTANAELLSRLVTAGGGAHSFRAATFIDRVSSGHPNEKNRLEMRFGAERMVQFATVFEYAVAMSLEGKVISARAMPDSDLGVALYRAGENKSGSFNFEQLFDALFGASAHMVTMMDVTQRYGVSGEATYHQVLTALIEDVGKTSAMPGAGAAPRPMASETPMASPAPDASLTAAGKPMLVSSPMPVSAMDAMDGNVKRSTNANGVTRMYGSSKRRMDMAMMSMRVMPAVTDLGVPMSREGSGTAWLPDSSTTFGHTSTSGDDMLMTHGAGFVRYSDTFGSRATRTLNAPDWYMAMGTHPIGPASQLGARIMVTSDFATVGGFGYPELFQTGESYHGEPLHDRQHPHDLFAEAALTYSTQLSHDTSAFVYFGYPGEPALGPPTFMHRLIAYDMPDAPIGHHWEDSTHITFGVLTAGLTLENVRFEASTFTGREPNEVRTNFDAIAFDSVSGRVSWNPMANLATQVSFGYIKSPEALAPNINQHRTTASIVYNKPLAPGEFLTASTVWGQNYESDGARSNAYLLEADYHRLSDSIYGRAEWVQKSGNELVLDADPTQLAVSPQRAETLFPIGAYTVGYVHDLSLTAGSVMGLGGQVTFNTRPGSLIAFYGPQTPWGFELFARFRPTALR